jgi:hypothetical protein
MILGVIGTVALVLVGLKQAQVSSRQAKATERLAKIEEDRAQKASITVLISPESSIKFKIQIKNIGEATARNLQVYLDDEPLHQHPHIGDQNLPSLLDPNSTVSISYHDAYDYVPPSKIRVTWVNETGEKDAYEAALQFS